MLYSHTFIFFRIQFGNGQNENNKTFVLTFSPKWLQRKIYREKIPKKRLLKLCQKYFPIQKTGTYPKTILLKLFGTLISLIFFYSSRIVWTRTNKKTTFEATFYPKIVKNKLRKNIQQKDVKNGVKNIFRSKNTGTFIKTRFS